MKGLERLHENIARLIMAFSIGINVTSLLCQIITFSLKPEGYFKRIHGRNTLIPFSFNN